MGTAFFDRSEEKGPGRGWNRSCKKGRPKEKKRGSCPGWVPFVNSASGRSREKKHRRRKYREEGKEREKKKKAVFSRLAEGEGTPGLLSCRRGGGGGGGEGGRGTSMTLLCRERGCISAPEQGRERKGKEMGPPGRRFVADHPA